MPDLLQKIFIWAKINIKFMFCSNRYT